MQRTQISLETQQFRQLRDEARSRGVSLSALLRELIDARFGQTKSLRTKRPDPLTSITGIAAGSGEPVGRNHDRFLYAAKRK